ncbi:hypothetical protein ACW9UR_20795 [Halovulum sp. GXIMD14794]
MARVMISVTNVATYPTGGGHWWVYANWALGLRRAGCDVYWLEHVPALADITPETMKVHETRLARIGLEGRALLVQHDPDVDRLRSIPVMSDVALDQYLGQIDLLLNFNYMLPASILARFRKTALVDIDPGLLQFWVGNRQVELSPHDIYFSTGETVGRPDARFPDCGVEWKRTRPVVDTETWQPALSPDAQRYTTVSGWYGHHWLTDGQGTMLDNNKRATFIEYSILAQELPVTLELALDVEAGDLDKATATYDSDDAPSSAEALRDYGYDLDDLRFMLKRGWRIRLASEVSSTPTDYMSYIAGSRGEFSCAKPSCMYFANAWVSDRTLCYLASAKPVVVQDTGPSTILRNGEGMHRFSTHESAREAFEIVESDYARQCEAARALAVEEFDAKRIAETVMNSAL